MRAQQQQPSPPPPDDVGTPEIAGSGGDFARAEDRKLVEFIQDADVLIMDSQFDSEEYPSHVGWGHGCVDDAVALALEANVRQLFLFHHDPSHSDHKISEMAARARALVAGRGAAGRLAVAVAREGEEFVLPSPRRVHP